MRTRVVLLIICFLFLSSMASFADDKDPFSMAGDVAIARPVGFVATVIGSAIFVVCLPFAVPSHSVKNTADVLVGQPFRFTFKRPLGDFSMDISYVPKDAPEKKAGE